MKRYIALLKFTESGVRNVEQSTARESQFRAAAEQAGVRVEASFWTLGEFDGLLQFQAPDEQTAAALMLGLNRAGNVRTQMMRAFGADEFKPIAEQAAALG